jgi:isoprenylcysteine carboxyl methyltransferase (ICMT) family protein YpbQ
MNAFWIFLLFVILQRIVELVIAKRNERMARGKGAIEFDRNGYKAIVTMHVAFLTSLVSRERFKFSLDFFRNPVRACSVLTLLGNIKPGSLLEHKNLSCTK